MPEPGMMSMHPCPACGSTEQTCTGDSIPGRVTRVLDWDETTDQPVVLIVTDEEVTGG